MLETNHHKISQSHGSLLIGPSPIKTLYTVSRCSYVRGHRMCLPAAPSSRAHLSLLLKAGRPQDSTSAIIIKLPGLKEANDEEDQSCKSEHCGHNLESDDHECVGGHQEGIYYKQASVKTTLKFHFLWSTLF